MLDEIMSADAHPQQVILLVEDPEALREQLEKNGCVYTQTTTHQETYLEQPPGEILKITRDNTLVRLHEQQGKLDVVSRKKVSEEEQEALIAHYGIKKRAHHTQHHFTYEDAHITITQTDAGIFLVIQADHIGDELYMELGIEKLAHTTASFAFL